MHRVAEYGVAAHWIYKEGGEKDYEPYFKWLRDILERLSSDVKDTDEYFEMVKMEMFQDIVFVFTPKGDVVEMPLGSIALDFAYRVHSDIGHRCVGCKVNGRIVSLEYVVKNGDIVEVLTSRSSGPKRDWLNIVRTSNARSKIRSWFNRERRGDNLEKGKELLDQAVSKLGSEAKSLLKGEMILAIVKSLGYRTMDDLLISLGDGSITIPALTNRLKDEYFKNILPAASEAEIQAKANAEGAAAAKRREAAAGKTAGGITVRGVDNVMTRLAHCCNPLPGDRIAGYVTRGRGVSIHRLDCANVKHYLKDEKNRILEADWDADLLGAFTAEIEVESRDRNKLTIDILSTIQDIRVPIHAIRSREGKNGMAVINLKVEIKNLEHLRYVIERVGRVKDVTGARRVVPGAGEEAEHARERQISETQVSV